MKIRRVASAVRVALAPFASITFALVGIASGCGGEKPNVQTGPGPQPTVAASTTAAPIASIPVLDADAGATAAIDAAAPAAPEPQYTVLKKGLKATSALASDGFSVYWVEDAEGTVTRISKKGGATMMFYSSPATFEKPSSLIVDDANVYWTQHVKNDAQGGAIIGSVLKASKDGGSPTVLAQNIREELKSLAMDAKSIYWLAGAGLMHVSKNGGGVSALAGKLDAPTSIAADTKHVYWTSANALMRMAPTFGGKQETLAKDQDKPDHVTVDDANVYWVSGTKVLASPKDKFAMKALATAEGAVHDFAIDATHVYWAGLNGAGEGVVMRVAKDGGTPAEKLAGAQPSPTGISVDKYTIYWATRGTEAGKYRDGTLVMLPKP